MRSWCTLPKALARSMQPTNTEGLASTLSLPEDGQELKVVF